MRKLFISVLFGAILILAFAFIPKWMRTDRTKFSTEKLDAVWKIELQSEQATLKLNKDKKENWWIGKETNADLSVMESLLKTLAVLQVRESFTIEENDTSICNATSVKLKISSRRGLFSYRANGIFSQKVKEFYVYPAMIDKEKTAVCMSFNKEEFFWVYMPGYENYWRVFFQSNSPIFLSREIINLPYHKIAGIEMDFPENPENSWILTAENSQYNLQAKSTNAKLEYDHSKLMNYLTSFTEIFHDGYVNHSLSNEDRNCFKRSPLFSINITDSDGNNNSIRGFPLTTADGETDFDRLFLLIHQDQDTVIGRYFVIDPLNKTWEYFLEK